MKKYIANRTTGEIHLNKKSNGRCNINKISDSNKIECGWFIKWILIKYCGFNGCHWCYNKKDKE